MKHLIATFVTSCGFALLFGALAPADAAGMRGFDNVPLSQIPQDIRSGQGQRLLSAGYLDVTRAPYNADNTGRRDASGALQQAINDAYSYSFTVYVPKGTYLLAKPIEMVQKENFKHLGGSNRKFMNVMVGDTTGGVFPVLKAKDGAIGNTVLINIHFAGSNAATRHYGSLIRGFTIDMGDNPNATALSLDGAQLCSIEDITIKGNFNVGIRDLPGSGGSTTNVKVVGGNIGIHQRFYRPTPSIHGVELIDQKRWGLYLEKARGGVIVVGFKIEGSGEAGVRIDRQDSSSHPARNLVMVDGTFETGGKPAIDARENSIYLRNIYAKAETIVANGAAGSVFGDANSWTKVTEYASAGKVANSPLLIDGIDFGSNNAHHVAGVTSVSAPPGNLVGLHAWDPARVPTYFNTATLDIRDYGATPDEHDDDDAPAINRALRDSASQNEPVFIPRGRFNVRQPIEVPAGASVLGSSFGNSIIYADESWKPNSRTALMRTENTVGNVLLMDFAVNSHEPATSKGLESYNNMYTFHGRTSNMLLRDVQINRKEYYAGGDQRWAQTVAMFSGNAGGRVYNLALDFHEKHGTRKGEHNMFRIEGTQHPLAFYQPDTESANNDPQIEIENAQNVTLYAFKYEKGEDAELLHITNSENIAILGGSGNYTTTKPFVRINDSNDVVVSLLARQGTGGPGLLFEDGTMRVPSVKKITTFKKGNPTPFGELDPPDFPYPGSPSDSGEGESGTDPCHLLDSSRSVPSGWGAAYDLFSSAREVLIKATCSTSNATIQVGNGRSTTYIYKTGYEWVNNAWRQIAYGGENQVGDWFVGTARTNITRSSAQMTEPNYVVAYLCHWQNSFWKCGCHNAPCTQRAWNLQAFRR